MTQTKNTNKSNQRQREKRSSKLKSTKRLILNNGLTGLLNNQKWHEIFETIEWQSIPFEVKTLLADDYKSCNDIRELESTSLLMDDSGDFIEFFEIERIRFKRKTELEFLLEELKVNFSVENGWVEVFGYYK